MTDDPRARLRAANPVGGDWLAGDDEALRTARLALRREPMPARRVRFAPARRGQATIALAGGTGAAVVAALVLSAGGAPSLAQAFPLLRGPGRDLRHSALAISTGGPILDWMSPGEYAQASADAHTFAIPAADGWMSRGEVFESPDGGVLCLQALGSDRAATFAVSSAACDSAADVEQHGLVVTMPFAAPACDAQSSGAGQCAAQREAAWDSGERVFVALVPAGAAISLTQGGVATPVAVDDGVATGTVQLPGSLTITNAGQSYTDSFPGAPGTTPGAPATVAPAVGATGGSGASGATGATGATGAAS